MLADNGDSRPMNDTVKTMSFFCVCVNVEKGGSGSGSVSAVPAACSTSLGLQVVFSLIECVSVLVVEARVALGCCIMVSDIG